MTYKQFESRLKKHGIIQIKNFIDKNDNYIFKKVNKKIVVIIRNEIDGIYDRWKMCYWDHHQRLQKDNKYIRTIQARQNMFRFGKKLALLGK